MRFLAKQFESRILLEWIYANENSSSEDTEKRIRIQSTDWEKILPKIYLIKDCYPKYI